ncbi:phosphoribosyltransferase family protein [Oscillospiraceae bacterium MB08-C2-2]|nr:phosphoribosyltransferase family protein [Oscillospiraceae bacterium MB08-C2-2]
MKAGVLAFLDRLAGVFFPYRCAICGQVVEYEKMCCPACEEKHLPPQAAAESAQPPLSGSLTLFDYKGEIVRAVLEMKRLAERRQACFFAGQLALAMEEHWPQISFDLITAVPQSTARRRNTGHNQAQVLARELAGEMNMPQCYDLLSRWEKSLPQHKLTGEDRKQNAELSYRLLPGASLHGERVLLVDDVLTTGATASACAGRLLEAGASEVRVVAVAQTLLQSNCGVKSQ